MTHCFLLEAHKSHQGCSNNEQNGHMILPEPSATCLVYFHPTGILQKHSRPVFSLHKLMIIGVLLAGTILPTEAALNLWMNATPYEKRQITFHIHAVSPPHLAVLAQMWILKSVYVLRTVVLGLLWWRGGTGCCFPTVRWKVRYPVTSLSLFLRREMC